MNWRVNGRQEMAQSLAMVASPRERCTDTRIHDSSPKFPHFVYKLRLRHTLVTPFLSYFVKKAPSLNNGPIPFLGEGFGWVEQA